MVQRKSFIGSIAAAFAVALLLVALGEISLNQQAFRVLSTTYSAGGGSRDVNLPFLMGAGDFDVRFTGSGGSVPIDLYADDCIVSASLDGRKIYSDSDCTGCKNCRRPLSIGLDIGSPGEHVLHVKTVNLRGNAFFNIEHGSNAFIWRLLALASGAFLGWLLYVRFVGRDISSAIASTCGGICSEKAFWSLLLLAFVVRLVVMPSGVSTDIVPNAMAWAENLANKKDLDFTVLERDYRIRPDIYMNKPPGWAEYPLAVIRILFGFTGIYMTYLVKFPALIGDLIVGWVIWDILRQRFKDKTMPLIASSMYLFNPGVIMVSTYLGKTDSLSVALLLLALKNIGRLRFIVYYGLAVLSKQFPLFMLPWLVFRKRLLKETVAAGAVTLVFLLPYLLTNPAFFLERMAGAHVGSQPPWLSWMKNLKDSGMDINVVGKAGMAIFAVAIIAFALAVKADAYAAGAFVFGLFVIVSPSVFEQYLMWSMPFLLISFFISKKGSALAAFAIVSLSCALNPQYRNLLYPVLGPWDMLLALVITVFLADIALRPEK